MEQRAPRCVNVKSPRANVFGAATARQGRVNSVVELLSLRAPTVDNLPLPNTKRWVVRRKAAVVAALRSGMITMEEALRRYQLSEEEFVFWQRAFEAHDLAGLRATRLQQYGGSRRPRDPRSRALRSSSVSAPAIDIALTVLSRLPTSPNVVSSLTFFANISWKRPIVCDGWRTCNTQEAARMLVPGVAGSAGLRCAVRKDSARRVRPFRIYQRLLRTLPARPRQRQKCA
jgi:hypothetical protein